MEPKNCPLCGKVGAIVYDPPTVRNAVSELTHLTHVWDYSHYKVCPRLKGTTPPLLLLRFHCGNVGSGGKTDQRTPSDYDAALAKYGLMLGYDGGWEDGGWYHVIFIQVASNKQWKTMLTKGLSFEHAFSRLTLRLRCGEIFTFGEEQALSYQMREKDGPLKFSVVN